MLKKTEAEETIGFFVIFLSLMAFDLGGAAPLLPSLFLATPMHAMTLFFHAYHR